MALIDEMDSHHYDFTRNPKTDFSRTKKWSFRSTFLFILSMEGNSLKNELLKFFDFNPELPSTSSFVQLGFVIIFMLKPFCILIGRCERNAENRILDWHTAGNIAAELDDDGTAIDGV